MLNIIIGKNKENKVVVYTPDNNVATIYSLPQETIKKALKQYIAMFKYIETYSLSDESISVPVLDNEQYLTIEWKFNEFYLSNRNWILCVNKSLDEIFHILVESMN